MKQKIKAVLGVMMLLTSSHLCYGQYFQRLVDIDSTYDWGWNIFLQPDGNYFIEGGLLRGGSEDWGVFNIQLSADGTTIMSKHLLQYDRTSFYDGNPGEIKAFPGGYLSPLQILQPHGAYPSGRAGLIKYNSAGDTVFVKTYTDTSTFFEVMYACGIVSDKGYIVGGGRGLDTPSIYSTYLIRTDSSGDTLWTRTYQKYDTQSALVNSVIPLADGRLVVGAMSIHQVIVGTMGDVYNQNVPWFFVLDSIGNLLRDTLYGNEYAGGGPIYNDMTGGYIHAGEFNYLYTSNPSDIENFPGYIAHLDTNFRITWITTFSYSSLYGHRDRELVRQLKDSAYIIIGDAQTNYPPYSSGWAAKISRTGTILWDETYVSDSAHYAYFRDVIERPDGGLVFVGKTFNDTCSTSRDNGDVWLVMVDSNGNPPPDYTGVRASPVLSEGEVVVYPNPTRGNFTIEASSPSASSGQAGEVMLYSIEGQYITTYKIKAGKNNVQLPATISEGVYFVKYIPDGGNSSPAVVRLIYQH